MMLMKFKKKDTCTCNHASLYHNKPGGVIQKLASITNYSKVVDWSHFIKGGRFSMHYSIEHIGFLQTMPSNQSIVKKSQKLRLQIVHFLCQRE